MVATPVKSAPTRSGTPMSSWKPSAAPRNSAKSVDMATISISTHMANTTGLGNCSRQCSARFLPVTRPSLAESACTSMAIRLLATITQMSR